MLNNDVQRKKLYLLIDTFGPANNKIGTLIHVVSCKNIAVERCFVKYVKYRLGNVRTLLFTLDGCIRTLPSSGVQQTTPPLLTRLELVRIG